MAERIPLIVSRQKYVYWWYKLLVCLFVCVFVCLCSEKRVLTIPNISTKWTIIFTSPYLT